MTATASAPPDLLRLPLDALHRELGARMAPFAGYSMPVQYPSGLLAEHQHTRSAAGLFDVSHMGQLRLAGPDAAAALESLLPQDVLGLGVAQQRLGLLTNDAGGIRDDLMVTNRGDDLLLVVNGACKHDDTAYLQQRIGMRCEVLPLPDHALLALQGPRAVDALARLAPGVERLVFMTGARFTVAGADCFITRSGYTGEDGFEISVPAAQAERVARALLAQPEVAPCGLGARNSLRLEAGLCLYGQDIDSTTTPVEANLSWAIQKVRRAGGARAGGFPGATGILAQLADPARAVTRKRIGFVALERTPVREPAVLHDAAGRAVGAVTSGLLSPTLGVPIGMGYVGAAFAAIGTRLDALVRGRRVPVEVRALPFVPHRYHRAA